jgi:hypothetical protein
MLPARPDHARVALRFALDLHAAAAATQLPASALVAGGGSLLPHVQIRVGLHSGPVTSGVREAPKASCICAFVHPVLTLRCILQVIGHLRARFCLFGDTVNVSSRMESTGVADCVQLSAATFRISGLPPNALQVGRFDVKGKGLMDTYSIDAFSSDTARVRSLLAAPMPLRVTEAADAEHLGTGEFRVPPPALSPAGVAFAHRPSFDRRRASVDRQQPTCSSPHASKLDLDGSDEQLLSTVAEALSEQSSSARLWLRAASMTAFAGMRRRVSASTAARVDAHTLIVSAVFCLLVAVTTSQASLSGAGPLLAKLAGLLLAAHLLAKLAGPLRAHFAHEGKDALQSAATAHTMTMLLVALAAARSEADILRAGCDAAMSLFPGSVACALGVFAEGTACSVISWLECGGDEAARRALSASLTADVGSSTPEGGAGLSSIARVCSSHEGAEFCALLDSRDLHNGFAACADWTAATQMGLKSAQAVTTKLVAGHVTLGFVQVHFGLFNLRRPKLGEAVVLDALADAVGGALFVRRALAINREASPLAAAQPASRVFAAPKKHNSFKVVVLDAAAEAEAALDDGVMLHALDESAAQDNATLLSWGLDAWAMSEAELQRLCMAQLHSLGLLRRFQIKPTAFAAFMADVNAHYNGA